jgi:hypothetical protein
MGRAIFTAEPEKMGKMRTCRMLVGLRTLALLAVVASCHETKDQLQKPAQDKFGGETVICEPEGRCHPLTRPCREDKNPKRNW